MARHVRPAKRESTERSKNRVSKNSSKKRRKPKIADDLTLLPHCKGPKLGPFSSRPPRIDFIDYLSDPETAAHAHVFEVEIGGVRYALKIVSAPNSATVIPSPNLSSSNSTAMTLTGKPNSGQRRTSPSFPRTKVYRRTTSILSLLNVELMGLSSIMDSTG